MNKKSRTATIRELAARANVSPATVSRVINNSGYVSEKTRKRVKTAIEQLGFRPDARARGLRGMPSGLIALVIPSILNVFYTTLAESIEKQLKQRGYTMLLGVTQDEPDLYLNYLNQFWELKVDGIISVPPPDGKCLSTIQELVKQGMPIVEVSRRHEECILDAVLADNFQGAKLGTEYLIGLGHQRIALIVGSLDTSTGKNRLEGFRWTMADAGINVTPELVKVGAFTKEYGIQAAEELLRLSPHPTAFFVTSNRLLVGVMTVLMEHHIRVPDDISILSFDDSEWLSFWQPPITAVDIAVDEMGILAVELIARQITSGERSDTPRTYSLSAALIERQSCAAPKAGR
ncbi:MAG: LacI family transcriptional regulator [Chloroflexi bacterium]|nr:LacI family transcriptional regulator [Chloroflexota bacterium]MDL1886039.1 LacI family transcriptional regulator [Anaerolineae bacterium CFX8]